MPIIQTLCIYFSKDVRIRGYFSKPKGVHEEEGKKEKKELGKLCFI
jgi:hypothetical protein